MILIVLLFRVYGRLKYLEEHHKSCKERISPSQAGAIYGEKRGEVLTCGLILSHNSFISSDVSDQDLDYSIPGFNCSLITVSC